MTNVFITGTDTDIGKTFISIGLALLKQNEEKKVGYFKPLQSGAVEENGILKAPDLYELSKYANIPSKYSYLLKGEVSPYLASFLSNSEIDINKIKSDFEEFSKNKDFVITEGAGGLMCPAAKNILFVDIIKKLDLETIIVTTPFLGKINHTLMTIKCAKNYNIKIKGLIINKMPKLPSLSEKNFTKELQAFTNIKILGILPEIENPTKENIINVFKNLDI